jgi:hypothetical protein
MSCYISDRTGNEIIPPTHIKLLCGNTASFDELSGISYRCNTCNAVVFSVGMPRHCKELYLMEEVVNRLKGK